MNRHDGDGDDGGAVHEATVHAAGGRGVSQDGPMSAEQRHHHRTRRLLWTILATATVASMAGNVTHAWAHQSAALTGGAIATAAIPPLALLSLTHLAGMWSRIRARGIVYWCFLVAVAAIATAAFRLSFDALRSLAIRYGYGPGDAALFPLILDGLVAVCTLGLVVLSRIEAPMHRGVGRDADADEGRGIGSTAVQTAAAGDAHRGAAAAAPDAGSDTPTRQQGSGDATDDAAGASVDAAASHPGAPAAVEPVRSAVDAALNCADSPAAASETWWRTASMHREPGAAAPGSPLRTGDAAGGAVHRGAPLRQAPQSSDPHRRLAHRLVDAGRTTVDLEAVQAVLSRTAAGQSSRTVATHLGLSPSAVQRIIKAARDEDVTLAG